MVPVAGKGWELNLVAQRMTRAKGVPISGLVCDTVQIVLGYAIKVASRFHRDAQMARR